tara:strand:- start:935 stop:1090 length:156 start_codon:yes stop_codon:yes gene_type:complete
MLKKVPHLQLWHNARLDQVRSVIVPQARRDDLAKLHLSLRSLLKSSEVDHD